MSDTVIKVENLSKKYMINHQKGGGYTALRDVISNSAKKFGRKILSPFSDTQPSATEEFFALNNVSFTIKEGQRVGIIGRNGAGKSTLLKILSRITEPTSGRIEITGRVASLLEVGTGFHPELTGRENVFLNGAILGMPRKEINRKFDEIVAFAEVEKFLDTPVKRYSSGMYVRLAFAVAAHLEPEILVVDEVLAVGDAQFQKKCLGKMEEVGRQGRTVIFVSHNMGAIQSLCDKAVLMDSGKIIGYGPVLEQIDSYINYSREGLSAKLSAPINLSPSLRLLSFELSPNPGLTFEDMEFSIELVASKPLCMNSAAILIYSAIGQRVAVVDLRQAQKQYVLDGVNSLKISGVICKPPFVEGNYNIGLYIGSNKSEDNYLNLISLKVVNKSVVSDIVPFPANARGLLELDCRIT